MSTRTRAAGLLTAIAMTALAACSGSSDSGGGDGESSIGAGSEPGTASDVESTAEPLSDSASGGGRSSRAAAAAVAERAVIATGTVSLTSKDVDETRRDVQRVVDARGGEITEESTESDDGGDTAYVRLVTRVPASAFGPTMVALEEAAVLLSSTRGSEDVTTQVIDTGVRVRAQEASLKRVELLLAEADTLKDIIWIESQLTSRQAELDSLKSQQAWLRDQTSLSTITVDISTAPTREDDDEPAGFVAGLRGGMAALAAGLGASATVLGALLPFAVVALVLALPIRFVVRRRRGTAAPEAPAAPAA